MINKFWHSKYNPLHGLNILGLLIGTSGVVVCLLHHKDIFGTIALMLGICIILIESSRH